MAETIYALHRPASCCLYKTVRKISVHGALEVHLIDDSTQQIITASLAGSLPDQSGRYPLLKKT